VLLLSYLLRDKEPKHAKIAFCQNFLKLCIYALLFILNNVLIATESKYVIFYEPKRYQFQWNAMKLI